MMSQPLRLFCLVQLYCLLMFLLFGCGGRNCFISGQIVIFVGHSNWCCFLHISSSWVKIRLYTENQLPRLPGSALKVPVVGWVLTHYQVKLQLMLRQSWAVTTLPETGTTLFIPACSCWWLIVWIDVNAFFRFLLFAKPRSERLLYCQNITFHIEQSCNKIEQC